jgi:predicted Zn-dependent protease
MEWGMRLLAAILAIALLTASAVHAEQRNLPQTDLDRDSWLFAASEVVSTGSAPHYQTAAEAAERAIVLSQPFDMLSPPNYCAWKDVEISFNPVELKAARVVGNGAVTPQRILSDYGGAYDDPRLHTKLAVILRRLSAASDRPDVDYSITILNSPNVNSYVLPNGQLYVTRGLLALANDSAEVASAMAHQMAHVIARHATTWEEQARKNELIGSANHLMGDPQAGVMALARSKIALASFLRAQELEADAIGVGIAARAGYDPLGASRLLTAMGRNAELRSLGRGPDLRSLEFLSSQPATPDRVKNAEESARQFPASRALRDKAAYLASVDGITYGEDPADGFVRGQHFLQPKLGFSFMAPEGLMLDNTPQAVLGTKEGGDQSLRLDVVKVPAEQSLIEYLNSGWIENIENGSVEELSVNGVPAATATAIGNQWAFRLYVVRFGGEVYRFIFAAKNRTPEADRAFRESIQTFRRLSEREKAVRPLHLKVVKVQPGDTVESLAAAMAFTDHQVERFQVLNGLEPNAALKPRDLVKIVVE